MKKLIDVYPYKIEDGVPEFLIFKRSTNKVYANQWRMVGGKVQEGETRWKAALRELKEETGLVPNTFWVIPSVNRFYEPKTDMIHAIPAFAAQLNPNADIRLDEEHTDYKWVKADEISRYIPWPEQRRLIKLIHTILTDNLYQILPEWLIEI